VVAKPVHPEWICQLVSQSMDELKRSMPVDHEAASQKPAEMNLNTRPRQEDLNVSQLLWDVAKKFQPQADVKNQLLVVGKTEPDSKVRGIAVQLRQALRNLVWNAINNAPEGGTVTLSSENESNMVKILVRDTGYGNTGHMDHESNDRDLATVKSIVEQHGGQVTVESDGVPGQGSCFAMTLPLSTQAPPETISVKDLHPDH
jgi:signal transduction histidine kinase